MSTTLSPGQNAEPSVTELVSGIVGDVQELGVQHLALFRNEIKQDLQQVTDAASTLAIGIAVTQVGVFLCCLMLVHLLSQSAPHLSLWVCYGIVGAVVVVLGAVAALLGLYKMRSLNPARQAAQAMKEDAQWLSTQT